MRRFVAAYKKDWKILTRDRAGLALLFIMPLALTIIMAAIQDAPFRTFQNSSIEVGLAIGDTGKYSQILVKQLSEIDGLSLQNSNTEGKDPLEVIQEMKLQALLIIPNDYSDSLSISNSTRIMKLADSEAEITQGPKIELVFDPAVNPSFRELIKAHCHRMVSNVELQSFIEAYGEMFPQMDSDIDVGDLLPDDSIKVSSYKAEEKNYSFNSVQHNVPAYAIFGIFFIALALAGNVIKEREDGSTMRLNLIPSSPWPLVLGRISAYQTVAFLQALCVFLAGIYLMPMIGLPSLSLKGSVVGVLLIIFSSGFAAAGLGQLLGSYFQSQQQASATGAISIIILAALGGIWVPTFAMPDWMQGISQLSPLNWSMSAFQDMLLRDQPISAIIPEVGMLCLFAIACAGISVMKRGKR